jgi:hypothetical protein
MSAVRIDRGQPPIVLTVFNGEQSEADVEAYVREMDEIYDGGAPFVGVTFMLRYRPDIAHIKRMAQWTRERREVFARVCRALVIVAPSAGFRFLFSTLLMLSPLPMPYTIVSSVDEAMDWITREVPKHTAAPIPRTLREYLRQQMQRELVR